MHRNVMVRRRVFHVLGTTDQDAAAFHVLHPETETLYTKMPQHSCYLELNLVRPWPTMLCDITLGKPCLVFCQGTRDPGHDYVFVGRLTDVEILIENIHATLGIYKPPYLANLSSSSLTLASLFFTTGQSNCKHNDVHESHPRTFSCRVCPCRSSDPATGVPE
ncbi:hypothetical protein EDB83DRAFT_1649797 [Lactarius deliciosus]|nr:hypothetical protein EDB83DRAFT_1649797 [Lactarius deliciosus]